MDHLGPLIGQESGPPRSRHHAAGIQDPETGERSEPGRPSPSPGRGPWHGPAGERGIKKGDIHR